MVGLTHCGLLKAGTQIKLNCPCSPARGDSLILDKRVLRLVFVALYVKDASMYPFNPTTKRRD